jgi:hypothetical protein
MNAERFVVAVEFTAFTPARNPSIPRTSFRRLSYVGRAPGFGGLYQVNFQLPAEVPPDISQCPGFLGSVNTTVALAGSESVDVGRICIAP